MIFIRAIFPITEAEAVAELEKKGLTISTEVDPEYTEDIPEGTFDGYGDEDANESPKGQKKI